MKELYLSIQEIQKYGTEMLKSVAYICEENNIRWFMAYGSCLAAVRHGGPIPWDYDIDIYVPESDMKQFLKVMSEQLPSKYWIHFRNDEKNPRSFPRIGLSGYETDFLHIDVYRFGGLPVNPISLRLFTTYSRILNVICKSKTLDIKFYYPDFKRRFVSGFVRTITSFVPLKTILKAIDKQAGRIPFDCAKNVASPITTPPSYMLDRSWFDESLLVDYDDFKVRIPKEYDKYLKKLFGDYMSFPPESERKKLMEEMFVVRPLKH